ncbi:MAG: N-acyl homoserine lactonase family protein [Rhodospirillales bacterium]|nr:N-acyl homoserine lactonase family protein [Rhodospirillales bacterium]MDE0381422.1 N-acyl homoserine lactonase family protein [Rhodospirillales bacterium]
MTRRDRITGPEGMRLYYVVGAMLHFDQSVFTHMLGMGNTIAVPTPIFLIDHPEGKVLFETGVHRDVVSDAVGHWGEHVLHGQTYVRGRDWAPQLTADNLVENQLAALGIQPEDIRYVIQSVLIPDHAGGVRAFPKSTIIVQYRELQDAWNPPTFMPYHYDQNELSEIRDYNFRRLYDEDYDVFGDGSVQVLFSPAHSRGEQALVVRLPNTGTVIMPAGVIPQKANWDHGVTTGTPCVDPALCEASMRRLMRIAELEDGMVMFHHDAEHWKTYRMAPEYYD